MPATALPQVPARRPLPDGGPRGGPVPAAARPTSAGAGRARALGVLLGASALGAAGAGALAAGAAGLAVAASPATTAEDLLVALAAGTGGALAATWALAAALVALARLAPSTAGAAVLSRTAQRLLPAVLRGLLVVALGAGPVAAAGPALAATSTTPAVVALGGPEVLAATTSVPTTSSTQAPPQDSRTAQAPQVPDASRASDASDASEGVPDVTWRASPPPRPTSADVDAAGALVVPQPRVEGTGSERPGEVVVVRGDTLWDIARRWLPAGADDAEVAAAWPAWHEANRAVLGDDPDLLLPGQRLVPPTAAAAAAGDPS